MSTAQWRSMNAVLRAVSPWYKHNLLNLTMQKIQHVNLTALLRQEQLELIFNAD